jgi:chromate transporter
VFTSSVSSVLDVAIALAALAALYLRVPPWLVVIACGALGAVLTLL